MSEQVKNEAFDYYQEAARSGFADMLHDTERNLKYSLALKEAIDTTKKSGKKANVLDIGTGTGLLAMLAAKHGADSVVTLEAFSPISQVARDIIAKNGFQDKIKIVNKHSTKVRVGVAGDMEQKANILVAELLDTELIGEGAISAYNHAHANLMEKDCICVPDSALIFVQAVECDLVDKWNTFQDSKMLKCPNEIAKCSGLPAIHDLQLSQIPLDGFKSLSDPLNILSFDFSGKSVIPTTRKTSFEFTTKIDGRVNAIFFWWDIKMNQSGSIRLSCAPHWAHPDTDALAQSKDEASRRNSIPWRDHWMQGCFYIPSAAKFNRGEIGIVEAEHDEYSWWFGAHPNDTKRVSIERPFCICGFHVANSRNRIMQINESNENMSEQYERFCNNSVRLYVGDHNMMALMTDADSFLLQEDPIFRKSLNQFKSNGNVEIICDLNELKQQIDVVIAEPHFNNAILPWDNFIEFWRIVNQLKEQQKASFSIYPGKASIHAVPVRFLNLHKIRWPLKSSCEGFDHGIFDKIIETASNYADANVEPFTLWEYPCVALGQPKKIFEMDFHDELVNSSKETITVDNFSQICNGIAFWVEYHLDEDLSFPRGPSKKVIVGDLIQWKMAERQGVHLIPHSQIKSISKIDIETFLSDESESLEMKFNYKA